MATHHYKMKHEHPPKLRNVFSCASCKAKSYDVAFGYFCSLGFTIDIRPGQYEVKPIPAEPCYKPERDMDLRWLNENNYHADKARKQ